MNPWVVQRPARGMTLIEILFVIGIFALIAGMVLAGFSTTRSAEITRATHQIANIIRYGYDKARVTGTYYRLHIKFEGGENGSGTFSLQEGSDRMYLPATDRDGKIIEIEEDDVKEQEERDRRAEESYNRSIQAQVYEEDGEVDGLNPYQAQKREVPRRKPPLFEGFEDENALTGLAKGIALPEGVRITSVRTADDLKPITEGEASIYFFPRGTTQKTHILLEDSETESKFTIKVEPLTGRVTIEDGHEELKLPRDANEEKDDLGKRRTRRSV